MTRTARKVLAAYRKSSALSYVWGFEVVCRTMGHFDVRAELRSRQSYGCGRVKAAAKLRLRQRWDRAAAQIIEPKNTGVESHRRIGESSKNALGAFRRRG